MQWQKLGKIFDPTEHELPLGCEAFAQSPQALEFDDFVRVYFSSRSVDGKKYLSHVLYADFSKDFSRTIKVSNASILPLGNLGTFDEHGIFPLNTIKVGEAIHGYVGGWNRRVSVQVDGSIGMAISHDQGETFQRIGDGPILTSSSNEPFLIGDPFVIFNKGMYIMYYIFGQRWIDNNDQPERVYKIAYACSEDGLVWKKGNKTIISDTLNVDECQALPTVIEINGTFHMYFCFREAIDFRTDPNRSYKLGYAQSKDGIEWVRNDDLVGLEFGENKWDSNMQCYPNISKIGDKIYLLYNGNEFGKFGFGAAVLIQTN